MKISKREKILTIVLILTAVVIFMMGDDTDGPRQDSSALTRINNKAVFDRYRHVRPFPVIVPKDKSGRDANTRNIFWFGNTMPEPAKLTPQQEAAETQTKADTEAMKKEANQTPTGPQPPDIDFKLMGVILAGSVRAAVITRAPELFVVRESQTFLNDFILQKVKRDGVVIGYTGFENKSYIPLEKAGGIH